MSDINGELLLAVERGDLEGVRLLADRGARVEANRQGHTALHIAVQRRNAEMASLLLAFAKDQDKKTPDGYTPLMMALHQDDLTVAEILLAGGADINYRLTSPSAHPGWVNATPLHLACDRGQLESVQWLVAHGADVCALDSHGQDGLLLAAMHLGRDWDFASRTDPVRKRGKWQSSMQASQTVMSFKDKRYECWKGRGNPLNTEGEARDSTFREIIQHLLKHGANPNGSVSLASNTPFFEAFFNGARSVASLLLEHGADINSRRNADGASPLTQALENQDLESMEWLWQHGADINTQPREGFGHCLLLYAIENDDIPAIEWLLEKGVDLSLIHKAEDGRSALVHFKSSHAFELLVQAGADLTSGKDAYRDSGVLFNDHGFFRILDLLEKASPCTSDDLEALIRMWLLGPLTEEGLANARKLLSRYSWWDVSKHSKLILDAVNLPKEIQELKDYLQYLKDTAASSVDVSNSDTCFDVCDEVVSTWTGDRVREPSTVVVSDGGSYSDYSTPSSHLSDTESLGSTAEGMREEDMPVVVASEIQTRLAALQLLLEHGCDCNCQNEDGESALHLICKEPIAFAEAISVLQAAGADTAATDSKQATCVHYAVKNRMVLKVLLVAYAGQLRLDAVDRFGSTPLHWAVLQDDLTSIRLLLEAGIDAQFRDNLGRTPFQVPTVSGTAQRMLEWWTSLDAESGDGRDGCPQRSNCSQDNNFFDQLKAGPEDDAQRGSWEDWMTHLMQHHGHHIRDFTERVMKSTNMGLFSPEEGDLYVVDYVLKSLQEVATSIARKCPILEATVHLAGSNKEGTKVGELDEIDVIFNLTYFSSKFEVEKPSEGPQGFGKLNAVQHGTLAEMGDFLDTDGKLQCAQLNRVFYEHFYDVVTSLPLTQNFQHGTLSVDYQQSDEDISGMPSISHCTYRWFTADKKDMNIAVDVVLAVELLCQKEESSCAGKKRLVPKSLSRIPLAVMKTASHTKCKGWEYLCRISASETESEIIQKLPDQVRRGFMLLKAYRDSWLFPERHGSDSVLTYHLKQAFLHCVDLCLRAWQTDLDECDRDRLVHAHSDNSQVPPALCWARETANYLLKAARANSLVCYMLDDVDLFCSDVIVDYERWIQPLCDVVHLAIEQYKSRGVAQEKNSP